MFIFFAKDPLSMDKGLLSNPGFPGRYVKSIHGSIDDYLLLAKDAHVLPEFHGFSDYRALLESGYLHPDKSVIRLTRHYLVKEGAAFAKVSLTDEYLVRENRKGEATLLEKLDLKAAEKSEEYAQTILRRHSHNWHALHLREHPIPPKNYR